jgi:hypothetical protein
MRHGRALALGTNSDDESLPSRPAIYGEILDPAALALANLPVRPLWPSCRGVGTLNGGYMLASHPR